MAAPPGHLLPVLTCSKSNDLVFNHWPAHIVVGIFTVRLYHLMRVPVFCWGFRNLNLRRRSKTAKAASSQSLLSYPPVPDDVGG